MILLIFSLTYLNMLCDIIMMSKLTIYAETIPIHDYTKFNKIDKLQVEDTCKYILYIDYVINFCLDDIITMTFPLMVNIIKVIIPASFQPVQRF